MPAPLLLGQRGRHCVQRRPLTIPQRFLPHPPGLICNGLTGTPGRQAVLTLAPGATREYTDGGRKLHECE